MGRTENGEEQWAVPTYSNRIRARNKIDRGAPGRTNQHDKYIEKNRPRQRNPVNYAQVREAMKSIDVKILGESINESKENAGPLEKSEQL